MASPTDPLDPDVFPGGAADSAHATRAPSLWPESTRAPGAGADSFAFAATGFDPLRQERERERERAALALDLCQPAVALRVLLFVQLALALGVLWQVRGPGQWLGLQSAAAFAGLLGAGAWLVLACALRSVLLGWGGLARTAVLMGLGAMAAAMSWWPLHAAGLGPALSSWQGLALATTGAAFAGLVLAWADWRARLWQPSESKVRLAELQSRIRPHFLFNALNTAVALVQVEPRQAERVLEDLAELFRAALNEQGASVPLADEVQLAERYLAIEQVRYGARLQVQWDVDPSAGTARVPPLVLQPLVENAVRHGVEPAAGPATVWVQVAVRRGQAVVLVSNTVPLEASQPGAGLALANVKERLRLLHDVAGQLDTWRDTTPEGEVHRARIVVPLA